MYKHGTYLDLFSLIYRVKFVIYLHANLINAENVPRCVTMVIF